MSGRRIRLSSSRSPYRRAGLDIGMGATATIVTVDQLGAERLKLLATDPNVEMSVEVEGKWLRLKRAELDLAIETAVRLTGERAHNPSAPVAPLAAASPIPPIGGGTGPRDIVSATGEALPSQESVEKLLAAEISALVGLGDTGAVEDGPPLQGEASRIDEGAREVDQRVPTAIGVAAEEAAREAEAEKRADNELTTTDAADGVDTDRAQPIEPLVDQLDAHPPEAAAPPEAIVDVDAPFVSEAQPTEPPATIEPASAPIAPVTDAPKSTLAPKPKRAKTQR